MPQHVFFNKPVSGPFTIPSGIGTVTVDGLQLLAEQVPQLGILTTKSIGPAPRDGNPEPVLAQVDSGTFVNAVGLANPGCEAFADELAGLQLPQGKALLVSIFGATIEEFQKVAARLSPYADALELNFSCPHAEGYGQEIGAKPEVASKYLEAVKSITHLPVMVKLSPNVGPLGHLAKALIAAGADGFTLINTFGPREIKEPLTSRPILSNRVGGLSGAGIKSEAIRCIKDVAEVLRETGNDLPIIGMGGISSASDVRDFEAAGASFFGVGTALAGMSTPEVAAFFDALESGAGFSLRTTRDLMRFTEAKIERIERPTEDLAIFRTSASLSCQPGQFVFVWMPGSMEKPFAPALDDPLVIVVRKVGPFTSRLFQLKQGDSIFVRGPYGAGFSTNPTPGADRYCLVGGGTGIAPLLLLAKKLGPQVHPSRIHVFLGARTSSQLYFVDEFRNLATVHLATDDGSVGFKGMVTALLESYLESAPESCSYFYNCGPERMEKRALEIEQRFNRSGIETSVERYMKCGVGICGICTLDGWRTCVDGPVLKEDKLARSKHFGSCFRTKTGAIARFDRGE